MSLSTAITKKDKKLLTEVVNKAVSIYGAKQPAEPSIETVNGPMQVSMAVGIDKKAYWVLAIQAYTEIVNTPLQDGCDEQVEIAKLIANNATLRAITAEPKKSKGLL